MKKLITILLTLTLTFGCFANDFIDFLQNTATQEITNAIQADKTVHVDRTPEPAPKKTNLVSKENLYFFVSAFEQYFIDNYGSVESFLNEKMNMTIEDAIDLAYEWAKEPVENNEFTMQALIYGMDFRKPISFQTERDMAICMILWQSAYGYAREEVEAN
jgi:hypothetical protein